MTYMTGDAASTVVRHAKYRLRDADRTTRPRAIHVAELATVIVRPSRFVGVEGRSSLWHRCERLIHLADVLGDRTGGGRTAEEAFNSGL